MAKAPMTMAGTVIATALPAAPLVFLALDEVSELEPEVVELPEEEEALLED